jgi:NAD(P)-dependent dehydrogenase (short-subunit alcohol dehydrogenase family)
VEELSGKVGVVTGGVSGIGLGLAKGAAPKDGEAGLGEAAEDCVAPTPGSWRS